MPLEQTRGRARLDEPSEEDRRAQRPATSVSERRILGAGLGPSRDESVAAGDRLVAARQVAVAIRDRRELVDDRAARAHVKRAAELVATFDSEHVVTLKNAQAGAMALVEAASGQLDRALTSRAVLRGLCEQAGADDREKLLRLAGAAAAGRVLCERLAELAPELPFSKLTAGEAEARRVRAAEHLEQVDRLAGEAFRHGEAVRAAGDAAMARTARPVALSQERFEEISVLLAGDAEAAEDALHAHEEAVAAAARAVVLVQAALDGKKREAGS